VRPWIPPPPLTRACQIVPKGQKHEFTRWSCIVWPYHRMGVVEVVAFQPSPRAAPDLAVFVNGMPFLSASPGITLWRVPNAHACRTSEGTVVFTDSFVLPASHMVRRTRV
jgi:hypothetical protein